MTYACPAWEFTAYTHLLKFQRLQNKILRTIVKFPRCTPARNFYTTFNLPMYTIIYKNSSGNKQKSYKIMRMNMFVV
jgi:hypothetical protein